MDQRDPATPAAPAHRPRRAPRRSRSVILFALIFVAIVLAVDALIGDRGVFALIQARRDYAELDTALKAARAENAKLLEDKRRLENDDSAIEELARQHLGLVKPGEILFFVKDVRQPRTTPH